MDERVIKNFLILLPAILIVTYASMRLYEEYHPEDSEQTDIEREVIGELVTVENSVKRQFTNDVLWNNVESKVPVYNKDSIRTGQESSALIKLSDNSLIELGENSLIVLDKSSQDFNVNFKTGDITTKTSSLGLNVKMKESTIRGQGAELKFKSGPGGSASVAVSKGKAYLTDKSKNTREIGPSELAGVSATGNTEITKLEIYLRSPEHRSKILVSGNETLQPFTWEVVGTGIKEEQFELSTSSEFKKELTQIFKGHQAISLKVKKGTYYWRVGWPNSQGKILYTDYRQLVVTHDKRLDLLEPENQVSMELEPQENKVDFRWKSQIPAKVYVLEVSPSTDFKQLVSNKPIATTYDTLTNFASGTYFWRVKAFGEKNEELSVSRISQFTIKLRLPKMPELIKPALNLQWPIPDPVEFSWKKEPTATDYKVVISRTDDFKDVVKTITTQGDTYNWKWDNQGTYYWSVRALKDSQVIGQSETRIISIRIKDKGPAIELAYPKDTVEVTRPMVENPDPILFQWKVLRPLPGPVTLLVSESPDFQKPITIEGIKTKSHALTLTKPGSYYWKVISKTTNREETSDTNTFVFKKINALAPPVVIAPENKSKLDFNNNTEVTFEWQPVEKASQYHLVLYRATSSIPIRDPAESPTPLMDKVIKETTVKSIPLPKGQYQWRLTSLDEEGQEGLDSGLYEFSLVEPELMEAPILNAPVVK